MAISCAWEITLLMWPIGHFCRDNPWRRNINRVIFLLSPQPEPPIRQIQQILITAKHGTGFTTMNLPTGDYQLKVVLPRPKSYSLAELQSFPSRTQITRHTCEEGWTAIAEWTGVPVSKVLQHAGILPTARYVNFYAYDGFIECIDMLDAFHPQTILAYGMNGKNLPIPHGAPVRLRVEKQVGYKSVKYLQRIVVTDEFVDVGDTGWSWYVGM